LTRKGIYWAQAGQTALFNRRGFVGDVAGKGLSVAVRLWLTADPTTLFSSLFEFAIAQPESLAGMINRFSLAPAQPDYNRSYSTRVQIDVDSLIPFMLPCHFFRE
jgi:hypothetical protein